MTCIFCGSVTHTYRNCHAQAWTAQARPAWKSSFFGKAPNVFVGKHGYPTVRVGILGAEQYQQNDEPLTWSKNSTPIQEIVRLRSQLVNSHFKTNIKGFNERFAEIAKDVSLTKRPVDIEINLQDKPRFRLTFEKDVLPHGPAVALRSAAITENLPVDTRVDKAAAATDLGASEAVSALFGKGIDEHQLTRAFSMGNFGIPLERKMVPTRWSITAVDDIIGKRMLERVRKLPTTDCLAYIGGKYGNYYIICMFDDVWQYELFEQFVPKTPRGPIFVETDYEPFSGRKDYVHETAGGYYAARIGILEHLQSIQKQSSVLAIRIITEEYTTPLGVWVVREAVRATLQERPLKFPDRESLLAFAKKYCVQQHNYDITAILEKSHLVPSLFGQKKLSGFFG